MTKFLPLVLFLAACSSGTQMQHYVGHVIRTQDVPIDNARFLPKPVTVTFEEHGDAAILYVYYANLQQPDTIRFEFNDSSGRHHGWHRVGFLNDPATIFQTGDSLYLSFGRFDTTCCGDSFGLKRVP